MQQMGEFDATIATAGYRDTEITQEHASQKNRGEFELSRDQTKPERENTWEQRKKRMGWFPVKPGPKQKERAYVSRERRGWGGSQLSRDQKNKGERERERTHESKERRGWGDSQLSRDQNEKKELMLAEKEEGGVVPS